jgi:hypothetical protein
MRISIDVRFEEFFTKADGLGLSQVYGFAKLDA